MKYNVKVNLKFDVGLHNDVGAIYSWYSPVDGNYDYIVIVIKREEAPDMFLERVKHYLTSGNLAKRITRKESEKRIAIEKVSSSQELVNVLNEQIRKDNKFTIEIDI